MESVRYAVALVLVVVVPPSLAFWFLVHPFVRLWRRLGLLWTYVLVSLPLVGLGVGIFRNREVLLAIEFGTRIPAIVLGLGFLATAGWLRALLHRTFTNAHISGLPELAPGRHATELVTQGLFAHIRHPRYAQLTLVLFGWALLANYLAGYVLFALWLPTLPALVAFEERELRDRFGQAYRDYSQRVPRFVPRWRRES
jgi:protein-S-isoprenylcysteine O-methyltransferase Ste14